MLLTGSSAVAQNAALKIFNATTAASPGQVIGLQGNGFTGSTAIYIQKVGVSSAVAIPPISQSSTFMAALVPSSVGSAGNGLYKVWTQNGTTASNAVYVNQAQAWQALDLAGSGIDPNRTFRLYGMILDDPAATSTVRFVDTAGGASLAATVTQGDRPYALKVKAPGGLLSGHVYDLYVSNGMGGTAGETKAPFQLTARAAGTDPFGFGVPWAADFAPFASRTLDAKAQYGAHGDGVTDDTTAIQNAINAASTSGGGVVYLPTGTYVIGTGQLSMKSNVVLKGDGKTATKIYSNAAASNCILNASHCTYIGLVNLTVESGPQRSCPIRAWACQWVGLYRAAILDNQKGEALYLAGSTNVVVRECDVKSTVTTGKYIIYADQAKDLLVRNSNIQWSDGRVWFCNTSRLQLDSNQFMRTVQTDGSASPFNYGGPVINNSSDLAILDNTFGLVGTGFPYCDNDTETILNENNEWKAVGKVSGGTSTTLADSTRTWTADAYAGCYVYIIDGPGKGQRRKVVGNTADALTVDQPWDIAPTTLNRYTVTGLDERHLIAANRFQTGGRGIWYYTCSLNNITVADNTFVDTDGIYLRTDQRLSEDRFSVDQNVLIEGNSVTINSLNSGYPEPRGIMVTQHYVNGPELLGGSAYNVMVRRNNVYKARIDNVVAAEWMVTADNDTAGLQGVIFDSNRASDTAYGLRVSTGVYDTVYWSAALKNVPVSLKDEVSSNGGAVASVGTVTGGLSAAPLDRTTWTLSASLNTAAVNNVKDDSLSTRWSTNAYQSTSPGEWFRIDMGTAKAFSRIILDSWPQAGDSPVAYRVSGSNDGATWTPLTTGSGSNNGVTDIRIPQTSYRYIGIDQTGSKPSSYWSIYELQVYP